MKTKTKKALVYSSVGLGDGLLFLIISNNLSKNGYAVDTYHPFLSEMNESFKYTSIKSYPKDIEAFKKSLESYDLIIINSDYESLNKELIKYTKKHLKEKTYELHPSTCKGKNPPIGDLRFDFTMSVVENLTIFCENDLNLKDVKSSNEISTLEGLQYRKFSKRVAIHPSSKDIEKNWPKKNFESLFQKLKFLGYEPYFIIAKHEREQFSDLKDIAKVEIPTFNNLNEMASFIYESAFFIGNDSGVAHLASSLKIPTLTIFSTKRKQRFWKPNFYKSRTVVSWPLLNIKGLRLREKYWKKTISVNRVLKSFQKLVKDHERKKL
ncbi:MAG: hypothetical protein K940chlam1_00504 [Candidatus Anoxychlamydiales bacterium]|nr:hypothetical protein [Candidatus Anoxychlamydiales bacterium]NGX35532.1 hypothetical protein [Candidatus Anoxychlamydiales bacterium]